MSEIASSATERASQYRRWSRMCGVGVYVVVALFGAGAIWFHGNGTVYYATAIVVAALATQWAAFDAKSRGRPLLHIVQMLFFFLWPVAATIYLIFHHGWRGILLALLHGLGLVISCNVVFFAVFYSCHYFGLLGPQFYR